MSSSPSPSCVPAPDPAADLAAALSPLVVVSPHYDDAVFSCGDLLSAVPGSTVITVCTGQPQDPGMLTDWDRRCGFSCAEQAMRERALENGKALDALRAAGVDLGFLDSQYAQQPRCGPDFLSDTLASMIAQAQPAAVFFPLGLFHEDHLRVSNASMTLCHRFASIQWFAYEDIPYSQRPEWVVRRLAELLDRGVAATPLDPGRLPQAKARAVAAYRSQFRGLGYEDGGPVLRQRERYWRLHCNMEFL
ncbi:PIG-L deacetylase family protein [Parapusillimonas granuli]|uniref:PIG-L family deacetylase n=1 Tax=Parapusillimonas granuli TaxID=380911 RepID=A0A853G0A4_9BURK|nr:PIG-L family deacetylase [Parapusillimonas granuli]MBB5213653.1 LmbE family N-acetylglucosaminyl deacetylase [Parapusillimonas granuli]MEB2398745.1 PIG-L family deacetylase [Alcaligenaceae bacterium]NYT48490.1 PIG-L family deacetylase [Parapusillimonas granuli]